MSLWSFEYISAVIIAQDKKRKKLDPGGVHHDAHSLSHGLRWKVLRELSPNGPGIPVRPGDLAPNNTEIGFLRLGLSGN